MYQTVGLIKRVVMNKHESWGTVHTVIKTQDINGYKSTVRSRDPTVVRAYVEKYDISMLSRNGIHIPFVFMISLFRTIKYTEST
jgi:hypothetical protein